MRITSFNAAIAFATLGSTSILLVVLRIAMIHSLLSCATISMPRRPYFLLTAAFQFVLICHKGGGGIMVTYKSL
jgi:hypothetical protein